MDGLPASLSPYLPISLPPSQVCIYYSFNKSLETTPVAVTVSLFSTSPVFVLLFSRLLLGGRERVVNGVAMLSVLVSTAGVLLMLRPWARGKDADLVGYLLALFAGAAVALYEVLLMRTFRGSSWEDMCWFMGALGGLNVAMGWVLVLVLVGSGAEPHFAADSIPWKELVASGAAGLLANFLTNWGSTAFHPALIATASVSGVPLNALIDYYFRDQDLSTAEFVGMVCLLHSSLPPPAPLPCYHPMSSPPTRL
jgi:drug/metabolite transporter (DMT)-like permease